MSECIFHPLHGAAAANGVAPVLRRAWVLPQLHLDGDLSCEFALQAQTLETRFRFKSRPASVLEQAWGHKKAALEANRSLPAGRLPILFDSVVANVHSEGQCLW